MTYTPNAPRPARTRFFRRGPWENTCVALIGIGILMLTQPFSVDVYSYSFVTILSGTLRCL